MRGSLVETRRVFNAPEPGRGVLVYGSVVKRIVALTFALAFVACAANAGTAPGSPTAATT